MTNDRTKKLIRALGPSYLGAVFARFVRFTGLAEDVIADFVDRGAEECRGVFKYTAPSDVLLDQGDELYRAHVRELCLRTISAHYIDWMLEATDAECLAAMMATSLKAPLNTNGLAVAEYLFSRIMPKDAIDRILGAERDRTPERYTGQIKEDLAALRRKLRRPDPDDGGSTP